MAVREATVGDLDEIAALIRELARYERLEHEVAFDEDALRRHLFGTDPVAHVLLAVDGGAAGPVSVEEEPDEPVVGFALWFRTFSTFLGRPGIWLEDLYVRPDHRGRGHGLALLQELRRRTDGRVEWLVLDWNEPALLFYRSLGAVPVEGWTTYRWPPGAGRS